MFTSYGESIILVSLAIYGLWHVLRDLWNAYLAPNLPAVPSESLLLVVKNAQNQIEGMVRHLLREAEISERWCDVVIVDAGSHDLTPAILERLALIYPVLKVCYLTADVRPIPQGMALCQGEVVHVLDFVNRLSADDFYSVAATLNRV